MTTETERPPLASLDLAVGWAVHDLTTSITHKGATPGRLDEDCAVLGQAIVGRIAGPHSTIGDKESVALDNYWMGRRDALAEKLSADRLARAWWAVVNQPEEGPYEHASEAQRSDARAWADALLAVLEGPA